MHLTGQARPFGENGYSTKRVNLPCEQLRDAGRDGASQDAVTRSVFPATSRSPAGESA